MSAGYVLAFLVGICVCILTGALLPVLFEARRTLQEVGRTSARASRVLENADALSRDLRGQMERIDRITEKTDTTVTQITDTVQIFNRIVAKPAIWLVGLEKMIKRILHR